MIPNDDNERESREFTREVYTAMGIVFGFVALAIITVALIP